MSDDNLLLLWELKVAFQVGSSQLRHVKNGDWHAFSFGVSFTIRDGPGGAPVNHGPGSWRGFRKCAY